MKFACKLARNEATIDNLKLGMKEMFIVPWNVYRFFSSSKTNSAYEQTNEIGRHSS